MSTVRARKHHRRSRRSGARGGRYALENPLSGTELFVGGITGLLGYALSDIVDRYLATHALTTTGTGTTAVTTDIPATDGSYKGLFNQTAILAPYDAKRWVVGGVVTAVPLLLAQMVKAPVGRSALQFFGFGYGFRFLGKALIDGVAWLSRKQPMGQRLYVGEQGAHALLQTNGNVSGNTEYGSLPAPRTGVGSSGCGCANCSTGLGSCCGGPSATFTPVYGSYAPPPPPMVPANVGILTTPSLVGSSVVVAEPVGTMVPASTSSTTPASTSSRADMFRSVGASGLPKKNPWSWGYDDSNGH